MKMKVVAIQMDCVLGEKDTNISKATKFVKEAKSEEVIVEEINLEDISSQRLTLPYLRD